jgi:hypothetical protein
MARRTSLAWIVLGGVMLAGTQRGDAAPRPAGASQDGELSANVGGLRIDRRDKTTPRQLNQLRGGSAMARELLVRVASLRDTILILRADPALVGRSGLYGRSRFWVHAGTLFGYIQYQAGPLNNPGTQCVIVHELAHAIEIASADWRAGTAAVRAFVLSRTIALDPSGAGGSETEFPQEVALAIFAELRGGAAPRSLTQIAEAHHIAFGAISPPKDMVASSAPR